MADRFFRNTGAAPAPDEMAAASNPAMAAKLMARKKAREAAAANKVDRSAIALALADLKRSVKKELTAGLRERNEYKARMLERTGGALPSLGAESKRAVRRFKDPGQSRAGDAWFGSEANAAVIALQRAVNFCDAFMRGVGIDEKRPEVQRARVVAAESRLRRSVALVKTLGVKPALLRRAQWLLGRYTRFNDSHRRQADAKKVEKAKVVIPDEWLEKSVIRRYDEVKVELPRDRQVELARIRLKWLTEGPGAVRDLPQKGKRATAGHKELGSAAASPPAGADATADDDITSVMGVGDYGRAGYNPFNKSDRAGGEATREMERRRNAERRRRRALKRQRREKRRQRAQRRAQKRNGDREHSGGRRREPQAQSAVAEANRKRSRTTRPQARRQHPCLRGNKRQIFRTARASPPPRLTTTTTSRWPGRPATAKQKTTNGTRRTLRCRRRRSAERQTAPSRVSRHENRRDGTHATRDACGRQRVAPSYRCASWRR